MKELTVDESATKSNNRYHFNIGATYHNNSKLITPLEAISIAERETGRGYIWMRSPTSSVARIVGTYDGAGNVFNGQSEKVKADPDAFVLIGLLK